MTLSPLALRVTGNASTTCRIAGVLYDAMRSRQKPRNSSAETSPPSRSDDERCGEFLAEPVRDADHLRRGDRGVRLQHGLDFARAHEESLDAQGVVHPRNVQEFAAVAPSMTEPRSPDRNQPSSVKAFGSPRRSRDNRA